jgi:hypothetical protein
MRAPRRVTGRPTSLPPSWVALIDTKSKVGTELNELLKVLFSELEKRHLQEATLPVLVWGRGQRRTIAHLKGLEPQFKKIRAAQRALSRALASFQVVKGPAYMPDPVASQAAVEALRTQLDGSLDFRPDPRGSATDPKKGGRPVDATAATCLEELASIGVPLNPRGWRQALTAKCGLSPKNFREGLLMAAGIVQPR